MKKNYRPDIQDELIEYAIENSAELTDKYSIDALNAISRVPPNGRLLKVVYKPFPSSPAKGVLTAITLVFRSQSNSGSA